MLLATLARLRTVWWLVAAGGLGLWHRAPDASAALLAGIGTFSADGAHRAHVFGFWATLLGLGVVLLAARLGHETSTRDRAWLGPRPCPRWRVAARQLGGLLVACSALALTLALASELRLSGGPAPRVLHAALPAGTTELVRIAPGATAPLALPDLSTTSPGTAATLHLSVAPSAAGLGEHGGLKLERVAAPTLRTRQGEPQTFRVGSARILAVDLTGHADGPLELALPSTGAGLRYVPSASWISSRVASAHLASPTLAVHWLLLTLALAGLAFGLAHHMRRTPAAALAASVPVANLLFGDPLALDGYGRSLRFAVEGMVPQLPAVSMLAAVAALLGAAWLLASLPPVQELG